MNNDKEYRINTAGKKAESIILEKLTNFAEPASKSLKENIYAFKTRVKPTDKLTEKVFRKNNSKKTLPKPYELDDITDVVGLRVVTIFRQEMELAVKNILELIESGCGGVFQKGCVEEVIIFAVNHTFDPMIPLIKSAITDSNIVLEEKIKSEESEAGYSSIHIVTRSGVNLEDDLPKGHFKVGYTIPIEIQIRTVFEDAWGEIDHKFGYQIREGKANNSEVKNPELIKQHLRVLKSFTDACAQYADTIKNEATDYVANNELEGVLDSDKDNIAVSLMRKAGVENGKIVQFSNLRDLRIQAEDLRIRDPKESTELYIKAKDKLKVLVEEFSQDEESESSKVLKHYVSLDYALCLLNSGHKADLENSILIYNTIIEDHEYVPIVYVRLGQAYSRLQNFKSACRYYKKASETVSHYDKVGDNSLYLPVHDKDYIKMNLPKLEGYSLWKHSLEIKEEGELSKSLEVLERAYNVTKLALNYLESSDFSGIDSINNNLLFYIAEVIALSKKINSNYNSSLHKDSAKGYLNYFEKRALKENAEFSLSFLDTIMYGYAVIDDKENSVKYAKIIVNKVNYRSESEGFVNEISTDIVLRASLVLAKFNG